jgi:MFS family permease
MDDIVTQKMTPREKLSKHEKIKGDHNSKANTFMNEDKIFGIEKTYLVLFLLSFSQGIQGLSDLAVSYLYKDDLKLEPFEVARISGIASIPWVIKPIYGFISDSFPILGYRRKPYLFFFGLIVSISWLLMSIYVKSVTQALIVALICSISTAFCNVIGEALVVELSQKQSADDQNAGAKNVSIFFMTKAIGSLMTAFSSGALLQYMDKRKSIFNLIIGI